MKYLFLILLIPTLSHANFVKEGGSVTYWKQDDCEKAEGEKCYKKPLDADTKSLKDVEVDDLEKPIIEEVDCAPQEEPNELRSLQDVGSGKCTRVVGFEKKLEKQFVVDPVKVKAKEDRKKAQDAKALSCEQYKTLLADSKIDDKSKAEDVMEVVRRLLGFHKECR